MLPALGTPSARSIFEVDLRRRTARRKVKTLSEKNGDAVRLRAALRGKMGAVRSARLQRGEETKRTRQY